MARALASQTLAKAASGRPWWRRPAPLVALALFAADALLLGQGLLAALMLVTVCGWLLPKALLMRKVRRDATPTVRLALLLSATAIAIMAPINVNNHLARQRAGELIQAVDLYRAANGRYPLVLDALVPRYIDAVPRAKFTFAFNEFVYQRNGSRARLSYVEVPPFARACYEFAQRRWPDALGATQRPAHCDGGLGVAEQEPSR